jgi:hypothetical protein
MQLVILPARRRREPIRRGPLFGFRWYLPEMREGPQCKRSSQSLNAPDLLSTGVGQLPITCTTDQELSMRAVILCQNVLVNPQSFEVKRCSSSL